MNSWKDLDPAEGWRLMVGAAIEGADRLGYRINRQPGRGPANTYEATKEGKTEIVSIRTSTNRWVDFPPLDGGAKWKKLDEVDFVLVSALDDRIHPQFIDVFLFRAADMRRRFDANYASRVTSGQVVRDGEGMALLLDPGDDVSPSQAGSGLTVDFPAIARFEIADLDRAISSRSQEIAADANAPFPGPKVKRKREMNSLA